jgi:hypothetical protein
VTGIRRRRIRVEGLANARDGVDVVVDAIHAI